MTDGSSSKRTDNKICGVCGDKALGYNFNAITCESCKAFFRRNALKKKEFKCPFNDSCKVDVVTRRFCQKCRLKKCFVLGMKKEWIMTDEEKKIKKQKIEENRHKRQSDNSSPFAPSSGICSPSGSDDFGKMSPPSPSCCLKIQTTEVAAKEGGSSSDGGQSAGQAYGSGSSDVSVDVNILTPVSQDRSPLGCEATSLTSPTCHVIKDTFSPTASSCKDTSLPGSPQSDAAAYSPCSSTTSDIKPPPNLLSPSPSTFGTSPTATTSSGSGVGGSSSSTNNSSQASPNTNAQIHSQDTVNSLLNMALKSEFSAVHPVSPDESMVPMSDDEVSKLTELVVANKALKSPITADDRIHALSSPPPLINVINLTDIAIRRLIKMSKKITGFKNLCEGDQIALLKGGCTELMILRSVMTYNPENDCWLGPQVLTKAPRVMQIKLDVLREAKGNVYEEHKRFIQSFERLWRTDENIMLILGAITLFTPSRPNVIHKDIIQTEQDAYYALLRNYLRSILSGCEARSAFRKLVQRIDELHLLNENHVRVYLDLDPKEVEPLLIEIFDLKNH